jgi:hypothetical protein
LVLLHLNLWLIISYYFSKAVIHVIFQHCFGPILSSPFLKNCVYSRDFSTFIDSIFHLLVLYT